METAASTSIQLSGVYSRSQSLLLTIFLRIVWNSEPQSILKIPRNESVPLQSLPRQLRPLFHCSPSKDQLNTMFPAPRSISNRSREVYSDLSGPPFESDMRMFLLSRTASPLWRHAWPRVYNCPGNWKENILTYRWSREISALIAFFSSHLPMIPALLFIHPPPNLSNSRVLNSLFTPFDYYFDHYIPPPPYLPSVNSMLLSVLSSHFS